MPGIDFQDKYQVYEIENGSLEAEILNIDVSNSNSHRDMNVFILLSLKFLSYLLN